MKKIFNLFIDGLKAIVTIPFWLTFFLYKMVQSLIIFITLGVKSLILFFQGKSVFTSKEDRAIEILRQQDNEELELRRKEAMQNADE